MNIYISSKAHTKLWAYIRGVNTEIGGWGYAQMTEHGDMAWSDTFLVPQLVSHSEVDFDSTGGDAIAIEKAAADGMLGKEGFVWVSWHSHHTMKLFWSGTDDSRIKSLRDAGIAHLVSFVGCHDHTYRVRYDAFGVEHGGVKIPQVTMDDLSLYLDPADDLFNEVLGDIDANVGKAEPSWKKNQKGSLGYQKTAPNPPKTKAPAKKPAGPAEDDGRITLEESLDINELINEGLSYYEAVELVKGNDYFIGPDGVTDGAAIMQGAQ